ncbi:hypothetical protein BTHE_0429 [Bifidobacterium thermophilum]|nr:hypothetical protein BTHE_0429 [Bifidobacterium thermophilum]
MSNCVSNRCLIVYIVYAIRQGRGGVWGGPVETLIVLWLPGCHSAGGVNTLPNWEGKGMALTGLWH